MAEPGLGRAVLELSTDDKKLDAGLASVPKKVAKTGDAVSALKGPLGEVNGLLETFGVGLSVGAVVAFGKALLDTADAIVKTSDRTGLAYDEVQKLQFIAEQSGNSLDDLTGAVSKLQIRLADGAAKKGIENLGLNFEKLRNSSPYEQIAAVADSLGKIENPTLRAQRAVEVFGKAGTAILPTLVANFKELGDAAPVMSDATVKALDDAGDAFAKFGTQIKVWAAESYNYARGFFDKLIAETYRLIQRAYENAAGLAALAAKLPGAGKLGIDQKLVDSLKTSSLWYKDAAAAMDINTVAAKKNAPAVAALPPIHEKASKEAQAHADAIRKLTEQLGGGGAIKAANELAEALKKLPPIQTLTKDAQLQIAKTMEEAMAVYAAAGKAIPRDLQLIAMAARAASGTLNESAKAGVEAMQKAWAQMKGIKLSAIPFSVGFEDPTWATRETLKATRSFAGVVQQIDVAPVQEAARKRMSVVFGPSLWTTVFADMASAISAAFAGGGGFGQLLTAAVGVIDQNLVAPLMTKLTKLQGAIVGITSNVAAGLGSKVSGATGQVAGMASSLVGAAAGAGMFGTAIAGSAIATGALTMGVGAAAIGVGLLIKHLTDRSGRKLVESWVSDQFGSFDNLQAKLLELGPEYDRLWKGISQLSKNSSTKEAQAAIDAVTAALDAQAQKVEENAAASEAAAKKTAEAQAAAVDSIKAKYAEGFKAINDEYKKLSDSVAGEAEEAEMGAQERADRARMEELEKQRAALETQAKEELAAKDETFAALLASGADVNDQLRELFGAPLRIPYEFVGPSAPGVPTVPMAAGGYGRVTSPTLFYSGGNEDFAFSGEGRSFGLAGMAGRPIVIENVTTLDGRVVARNQVQHVPNALSNVGVRSN